MGRRRVWTIVVTLALLLALRRRDASTSAFQMLRLKKLAKLAIISRALAPQIVPIPVPYGGHAPVYYPPPPPPPPPPPQQHYQQHYAPPQVHPHPVPIPVPVPVPVHHHHHIVTHSTGHATHLTQDGSW
nr:extensin-1-like [Rhipicephalus microplus]